LLTGNPAKADLPSQPAQISNQLLGLDGDRSVESLLDTPSAIELVDDKVGISIDRHSPWRARTKTFQGMKDTGILRHIVGHGAAFAEEAIVSQDAGAGIVLTTTPKLAVAWGLTRWQALRPIRST
jgi:hypothetical protein